MAAKLKDKIEIDLENIDRVLAELPDHEILSQLSVLELAGVATLLHNFYNGIENILKRVMIEKEAASPSGSSWHKELLSLAADEKIISTKLKEQFGEFLAFRHFFSHAYAIDLYAERMEPLVKAVPKLYEAFKIEIAKHR